MFRPRIILNKKLTQSEDLSGCMPTMEVLSEECSGEEFFAQPKKNLGEAFSGEEISDEECSDEKFSDKEYSQEESSEAKNYPRRRMFRAKNVPMNLRAKNSPGTVSKDLKPQKVKIILCKVCQCFCPYIHQNSNNHCAA
jgi:hypothetical protein